MSQERKAAATSIDIELQTPDTRVFRLILANAVPRHPEKPSETKH